MSRKRFNRHNNNDRIDTRHFQSRCKERYNIDTCNAMLRYWVRQITEGHAEKISSRLDKENRVTTVYKLIHDNKPFYVVFREVDKRLITALPPEKFLLTTCEKRGILTYMKNIFCKLFHVVLDIGRHWTSDGRYKILECQTCKRRWDENL